jgi:hypothetical protein
MQIGIDLQRSYRPEELTTLIIYEAIMAQTSAYADAGERKIITN